MIIKQKQRPPSPAIVPAIRSGVLSATALFNYQFHEILLIYLSFKNITIFLNVEEAKTACDYTL